MIGWLVKGAAPVAATTAQSYTYNDAGYLHQVCLYTETTPAPCDPEATDASIVYTYDDTGNRLTETRTGTDNPGTITTTHDADGNLTSNGTTSWTYDAIGNRIAETRGDQTTTYTWDINQPLPKLATVDTTTSNGDSTHTNYRYDPTGMPSWANLDHGPTALVTDALGSITSALLNFTAEPDWTTNYEPFGAPYNTTNGDLTTPHHQPHITPYAYVNNQPTHYTDPSGACPICGIIGAAEGAIVGGAGYLITNDGDFDWGELGGAVSTGVVVGGIGGLTGGIGYAGTTALGGSTIAAGTVSGTVGTGAGLATEGVLTGTPPTAHQFALGTTIGAATGAASGWLINRLCPPGLLTPGKTTTTAPNTGDNVLPGLPTSAPKPLGLGSTGRTVPDNLAEQLAMTEVRSAPRGRALSKVTMTDPRWPAADGWVKMQQVVDGVNIHYVRNTATGTVDDLSS